MACNLISNNHSLSHKNEGTYTNTNRENIVNTLKILHAQNLKVMGRIRYGDRSNRDNDDGSKSVRGAIEATLLKEGFRNHTTESVAHVYPNQIVVKQWIIQVPSRYIRIIRV